MGRRFLQYLNALRHHFLLLIGSAVLLVPGVIEFFLPATKPYIEPILNSATVVRWTQSIGGYVLLFLATFLAWNEEREAREKAERSSPEELKKQVRSLTARLDAAALKEWRALAQDEQDNLVGDFRKLGQHSIAIVASGAPDCMVLANSFSQVFERAGWSVKRLAPTTYAAHAVWGLDVLGKDADVLAHAVGEAITNRVKWSVGSKLVLAIRDPCELRLSIGPKPPMDWHLK